MFEKHYSQTIERENERIGISRRRTLSVMLVFMSQELLFDFKILSTYIQYSQELISYINMVLGHHSSSNDYWRLTFNGANDPQHPFGPSIR
jgi:hypothetical protein